MRERSMSQKGFGLPTPKLVLDAGTSLELTVQEEQSHGLPDVVVVSGGNCCGMSSDTYRFMLSPAPRIILQDKAADQVSIGPEQSFGKPDLCFVAIIDGDEDRCWRFDGKVYTKRRSCRH
jgi:hypothetical protein